MKKIFSLFSAIFIFSSSVIAQSLTKQDLLEFYPNNIGNSWSYRWLYYHVIEDFYEAGTDKIFISADTLINNTKFWKVEYNFGTYNYENYFERIDTATGDVIRMDDLSSIETNLVDNVYATIGDTISISNNRYLLYCDKIVVLSFRDTIINNLQTTIREVVGLPSNTKLYFARNIGMLGSGKDYWIDTAIVNGIVFSNITDVKDNYTSILQDFILYQNYPNPFNPITNISYTLRKSGFVILKLFDVLGKEIRTLVSEEKSRGNYTLQFNASNLSSGIYFYQLIANGFIQTKKMIVLE